MRNLLVIFILSAAALLPLACGSSSSPTSTPASNTATPTFTYTPTYNATITVPSSASVTFSGSNQPYSIAYSTTSNKLWVGDIATSPNSFGQWTTVGSGPSPNITTFSSGTTFYTPIYANVDPTNGNVYVADYQYGRFDVFSSTGSYLTAFGRTQITGQSTGVAVNSAGTTVCGIDYVYGKIFTYSIGGTASAPTYTYQNTLGTSFLSSPDGMHFDSSGNLWVADFSNKRMVEYNSALSNTSPNTLTLSNNGGPADIAIDSLGNLFIDDSINNYIQVYNAALQHLFNFGPGGTGTTFSANRGLAFDPTYTYLYVTDYTGGKVYGFKVH